MACILVHRRHSTKLASLPFFPVLYVGMPREPGAVRSWSLLTYLLQESFYCHFVTCTAYVYIVFPLYMHFYFEWRGYTNYLCLGNVDIRSIYFRFYFSFCLFHFGVRRPGLWVSRTITICCVSIFTVSIYVVDVDGCIPLEFGWIGLYWYVYVLLEVGIGRESALEYLYVLIVWFLPFGAPSLYSDRVVCCPSNRWTLSVFLQKL